MYTLLDFLPLLFWMGLRFLPRMKISPQRVCTLMPKWFCGTIEVHFQEYRISNVGVTPTQAHSVMTLDGLFFLATPKSSPSLTISVKVYYIKCISRSGKGLLIFRFVVPNFTKHAVTSFAALFLDFEKTSISYWFSWPVYEIICYLMIYRIAIQAIKNNL